MGYSLIRKLIESHLVEGKWKPGTEIGIRIDQTLVQDATGTMTCLQFEALGIPRVMTELSVVYVDHNTIQVGFENADDHRYLQSVAARYGMVFSRAGNGICHQVHLERFARPGRTLLGADSHTPTAGGMGMLAIGAGGLDVAIAMGGAPFYLTCPKVIRIELHGRLKPWVAAKDVVLEVLRRFGTKGNVHVAFEYGGKGVATLSVPERATIANMGAECGVTTSVFPSDEATRAFLDAQERGAEWIPLAADPDAEYEQVFTIRLQDIVPLAAAPHSPGNVVPVDSLLGIAVDQVCIGSCTNSSYQDLVTVARILKGRTVAPSVSLVIAPGSRQVLLALAREGYLEDLIAAGARLEECACGFCIGNSQSPGSKAVSLRTSNRNFEGRSGTRDARVYLVSCETAAAAALTGRIVDPRTLPMKYPWVRLPRRFPVDDRLFLFPRDVQEPEKMALVRGPNIGPPPINTAFPEAIRGVVGLKVGDRVTTDHILPAGARMKYRSNIAEYARFVFETVDPAFAARAAQLRDAGQHVIVVAGESYGEGSSREHAAICPMFLGVRVVLAKSFQRIHADNLANFGILPLTFKNERDYDVFTSGDELEIADASAALREGRPWMVVHNRSQRQAVEMRCTLSDRQRKAVLAGGLLALRKSLAHTE